VVVGRTGTVDAQHRDFRAIMGAFPTGVVIVTTSDENGAKFGITINAICSVSAEPPLLLISVAHDSQTLPVLRRRRRFLVNFLAKGSGEASKIFATKATDKFERVQWSLTPSGNVLLHNNVVAYAECTTYDEIEAGDHTVILGKVYAGKEPDVGAQPLLYFRRQYDAWPVAEGAAAPVRQAAGVN
jgi:flavin reductase (DIM6/NTAB) family NADH-FMN oxidoreductase RutF